MAKVSDEDYAAMSSIGTGVARLVQNGRLSREQALGIVQLIDAQIELSGLKTDADQPRPGVADKARQWVRDQMRRATNRRAG